MPVMMRGPIVRQFVLYSSYDEGAYCTPIMTRGRIITPVMMRGRIVRQLR